ncbi:MAG: AMP-binding protein [Thermodesulfobacteriota bacterium]|nr:AMP-binding protein [Thermodesulfobacteriota bacterium]
MANEGIAMLKMLLNKRVLRLLMMKRTRKIIMNLKKGNIFLSELDKYPDKDFIIYGEKRFKYRDFKERINRFNNGLLSMGLKKGDHISAMIGNSNSILEVVLGPTLTGIVTTPVNWHLKGDEIEYIVNNSESKMFFVDEEFLDRIIPIRSRLKNLKSIIVIGDNVPDGMVSYEKFLSDSSSTDLKEITPGHGFMLYTSGTTGRPKGAHSLALDDPTVIDPNDVADFILMMDNIVNGTDFGITTNIHLVVGPIYHAGPLAFLTATLFHGGTVVIMRKFTPEDALKLIEKEKVSTSFMPPIILKRLIDFKDKEKYDVSSMKSVVSGAAPCPVELKKKVIDYFGPVFYELYGSTEAGFNTVLTPNDYQKKPEKLASVGRVAPGNKMKVLDENGKVAPNRTVGDLYLSNSMVKYLDYYRDTDKTEGSFAHVDGEKYFIEGEVAYFDEDGFCYIVDRKKDMIISGGVNIYPAEIEEVIHLHKSVSDVAVIGVPDEEWGESVKAVVVLKEDDNVTADEIIALCNEHLAGYKRPKSVEFVEEIPRHADGKLIKRLLREKYKSEVK